jgi:hypothetical protein
MLFVGGAPTFRPGRDVSQASRPACPTNVFPVCHSSPRNPRETDGRTPPTTQIQYMTSPTGSPAPVPTAILPPEPKDIGYCWRNGGSSMVSYACTQNPLVVSVGNLRESSIPGKGICGRLPSRGKTENGPPNQLGSDVPRIVHGRRLLPMARWRLAVAAVAGTRR